MLPTRLQGLDPAKRYRLTEINLMPGQKSELPANGQTYSGDHLIKAGVLLRPRSQAAHQPSFGSDGRIGTTSE